MVTAAHGAVFVDLGRVEYALAWDLQKRLVDRRVRDEIPDTLLLVEHPPVITLGRRQSARANVLRELMPIFEIERGGDVTYHGPGQLVGYPILKLEGDERDLHAYLRHIEDAMIGLCEAFGVPAGRKAGWTGAWVGDAERQDLRKIASIGIAVRRWVTLHGFAFNVATDLSHFTAINPCGLEASVMTSLSVECGRPIALTETIAPAVAALSRALGRDFVQASLAAVDG